MARILVIEDNPANLELMTYLIEAFGHQCLTATTGTAGMALADQARPDIIVCDVQLPDIEGYAIARQLKGAARLRDIPLIAVTALAMVGDRDRILATGFDGYIAKPIVPESFVAQLEAFLGLGQPTAAPARALSVPASAPAPRQPQRASVLIVDDAQINRDLLRSILEPFGYTVRDASGVRAAIDLARSDPPDLVVSDLHMPDLGGLDLIRLMRADPQLALIKIVIHSATVMSDQDCRQALALGAHMFIARPIEPQLMIDAIEACLR